MARTPAPWYRQGKRMWFATIDGRQTPLNVTDPQDPAAAWAALKELISGAVKEAVGPPGPRVEPGSVADLAARFLEAKRAQVKPATVRGYGQALKWLARHFGAGPLAALELPAVAARAAAEGWSDTHRANVLWTVNALLRSAGRPDRLPLPPKESRGADSVIPEPVYRRVLAETKGDFRAFCEFLWHTGARPGEASGLTAAAVDLGAGTARIKEHKTRRHGKTRTVHLCADAARVLRDQLERHGAGFLFRGHRGRPYSLQALTMRFERVSARVGHRVTSYMFRHTWATRALAAGESDATVAALLGHSSTTMLHRHYSHLTEQGRLLRAAADRVARAG